MRSIRVHRDFQGKRQVVGFLEGTYPQLSFRYDEDYVHKYPEHAISVSLPVRSEPYGSVETARFFDGLLPEEAARTLLAEATRTARDNYAALLARLSDESVGALVLETEARPAQASYKLFGEDGLAAFAGAPRKVALQLGMESRLSLAGAQSKVGLYRTDESGTAEWFVPCGSAPSTHIVKAASGIFENQLVNEALCMEAARKLGFTVPVTELIETEHGYLLAVERFDRVLADNAPLIDGLSMPMRLHQEDLCQAAGLPTFLKYEPTDGRYPHLAASVLQRASSNPFGDRMLLFQTLVLDFLLGNCDNHLKNRSILWSEDWKSRMLSPLYDLTCTTVYSQLDRQMGMALCASRRIDDVCGEDVLQTASQVGVPERLARSMYAELASGFGDAVELAAALLGEQGVSEAAAVADALLADAEPRRSLLV
ncbi:HipA domain-containing protein [Adlercreutzia aquisgranensis]|uniref:Type II toxin-antitoxin system HipA family toxin n=1 Tax=Muribaculaceae bacterium Z82 TaxID=2304548 RepID=A0A7C9JPK7_9BACT|nr:HipA domain-containing protein [Adlercreutzia aquisgranensis]